MTNKQEVNIIESSETEVSTIDRSPAGMIIAAIGKGDKQVDLAQLKELLALQKDWEANEARKVFALSFAETQAKIAVVLKTKVNPQTHSKYADLGDVIESSKPVYTAEGFSIIFYENDSPLPEHVRICADVLHRSGHKETYHYDTPLDGTGIKGNANMTKIHGKASSVAYARRYLMCMIWNIPTQDDDGNKAGVTTVEYIGKDEVNTILDLIAELNANLGTFCTFMKVTKIEEIRKDDYAKAIKALEARKKAGVKA